ncbi:MAG: tetratricopeptide repeat protein [Chloroflexi bacterium]|nr:tetratricopeptide repeat protein [Chloroflexota bacterium]
MTTPLLTTKLHVPPVRLELVSRLRLIERLNAGLGHKLTLISAPAGFGKTTLLSEWVIGCGRPVAWLSLDKGDNDPARFLAYVVAALQTIETGIGDGALGALQSPQPPPFEAILMALVNEIAAISDRFLLVLDDCHVIRSQAVHGILTFLLDHLPSPMHLVIAGRADPLLPLALLRGRGQLVELREHDLRFTVEEASAFLNRVMGLELLAENIVALERRTEGWITGLQLAAIAMQGRGDTREFVNAFAGSHRYVLDYLTEQVLERQSENVQSFLLKTAILDRLTGSLCSAVSGQDDGQTMLESLEQANLFIIPLDDERRWYRYHHLFADLLRARLEQAYPDLLPELHRRASAWYEENRSIAEAVNHTLAAQDFERATDLISQIAWTMLMRGEMTTLLGWLDALPDEMMSTWPWLSIYRAWSLVLSGKLGAVEPHLQYTEQVLPTLQKNDANASSLQAIRGSVIAVRAYAARLRGDIPSAIGLSHQALEHLPKDGLTWRLRGAAALNLGLAYWLRGDAAAMSQALTDAVDISRSVGDVHMTLIALGLLGQAQEMQGGLRQAADTYRQVLRLADEHGAQQAPFVGLAHVGLAGPLVQWGDLEGAMPHVTKAIELGQRGGSVDTLVGAYETLSMVLQARDDIDGALEAIQKLKQLAQGYNLVSVLSQLKPSEVRLRLAQGDVSAATRWVEESGLNADDECDYAQRGQYTTLARVLIAQGKCAESLRLLARLQEAATVGGRMNHMIRLLVLESLAYQAQHDTDQAMSVLEQALSLAKPEGYVRVFANEGPAMATLLQEAAARGISSEYVNKLLATFDASKSPSSTRPQPLIEPLSEREIEVLQLVAAGKSNQEIADELVIALSTVKSHTNHIYGKLGVRGRTRAIVRAQELGLL